jgi:hypothetical protein
LKNQGVRSRRCWIQPPRVQCSCPMPPPARIEAYMSPSASTSSPILDTIDSNFKVQTQWMMTATYLMKWLQGQRCEATFGHFPGDENWLDMLALPLLMCQSELCVLKNGYNEEEMKMVETRKIWVTETISDRSANWSEYYLRKPALLSIKLLLLSWIGRCKCLLTICPSIYKMTRMWK